MINQLTCPLCESTNVSTFLERFAVPVHQNLLYKTQQAALEAVRGDLILGVCEECSFVFNRSFEASKLDYNQQYENTQLSSPYFQHYVDELVQHLVTERQVINKDVVEIGCGKGDFLRALVLAGNRGIGFDPSYLGLDSVLDGQLQFKKQFFDDTCVDVKADVVVCRHVIEHIASPTSFLRTIALAIENKVGTHLFFETPDITWILRYQVIWDLFYEHCSYFTPNSLATLFEMTGFSVEKVSHVFNGQYLWLEGNNLAPQGFEKHRSNNVKEIVELCKKYSASEKARLEFWGNSLREMAKVGQVAIWGAGAKGVTFANLVDPAHELIKCVVDLNPSKHGGYLPGTSHPIIHYEQLAEYDISSVVVLNPNYFNEVESLIQTQKLPLTAINLGELREDSY